MKMIDVSKVRVFRVCLFVLFMLFMRIGWASNDDSTYNIVDFGAKGDGITDNTQFINRTIEDCSLRGGGTVIIPEGTFLTGSILLKSKVNLFLESNAVVKGINNLEKYRSISDLNQDETYYKVKPRNWNKALLLGDQVEDVSITGEGVIDGAHIQDKKGEEGMRGPHILFLSRSKGIKISGVKLRRASNYAFMSYDIERASFDNLLVEEGWDGIHIRGGKDIRIRNCRFNTGDDAVAGGLWKNVVIENCYMNSSCNGIRLIMPATGLKIVDCEFRGPGKYPHRTSGEQKRRNMLSGILLQPGAWFPAFGEVKDILISSCSFDQLDNPFLVTLNEGNRGERICLEHIRGTRLMKAAASVESWGDSSLKDVRLSDVSLSYVGNKDQEIVGRTPSKPLTDYRALPCWGLYLHNLDRVILRNVRLDCENGKVGPASCFDNVGSVEIYNVSF